MIFLRRVNFFLLGILVPIPIFFDVYSKSFIILKIEPGQYPMSLGAPIPVSVFCVTIIFCFLLIDNLMKNKGNLRVLLNKRILITFGLVAVFSVHAILYLDFLRLMSLVLPFFLLIFLMIMIDNTFAKKYLLLGFFYGFIFVIFFHFFSIIFSDLEDGLDKTYLFFTINDYFIYQALVSYSAVLSFLGCTLLVLAFYQRKFQSKVFFLFIVLMIYIVLGYGARKAVALDVVILIFSAIMVSFFSIKKSNMYIIFISIIIVFYLTQMTLLNERALVISARGRAYAIFVEKMMSSSYLEVFFGHGGGWGGYSNIFVTLIYRLGLVGCLVYIFSLLILLKATILKIRNVFFKSGYSHFSSSRKIWGGFFVISLVAANTVNLNIQLPYYTINILFISLYFLNNILD